MFLFFKHVITHTNMSFICAIGVSAYIIDGMLPTCETGKGDTDNAKVTVVAIETESLPFPPSPTESVTGSLYSENSCANTLARLERLQFEMTREL